VHRRAVDGLVGENRKLVAMSWPPARAQSDSVLLHVKIAYDKGRQSDDPCRNVTVRRRLRMNLAWGVFIDCQVVRR
jgi:hypothetical protein